MEKIAIKAWPDPMTVPSEIQRMKKEYEEQGYKCTTILNNLILHLEDGIVGISWEKGVFYQTIKPHEDILKDIFEEQP